MWGSEAAFRKYGGHDGVFRSRNRSFVQEQIRSDQFVGLKAEYPIHLDPGSQFPEGEKMGIQSSPPDDIPPRRRKGNLAAAGQQRPCKEDGRPYLFGHFERN